MLCRRLVGKRLSCFKSKQVDRTKSIYYFNDDLKFHRPFDKIVKVSFEESNPQISLPQFKQVFEYKHGPVNAWQIVYESSVGYINFESSESKEDALSCPVDTSLPFKYTVQDYDRYQLEPATNMNPMPFSSSMVAAFRPSLHSVGQILLKCMDHGYVNGFETRPCPYDSDRAFLYCNFQVSRCAYSASKAMPTISGNSVAACSDHVEDVLVWRNADIEFRKYGRQVMVQSDHFMSDDQVKEIVETLKQYGNVVETAVFKPYKLRVRFQHPVSVFKLFYHKTFLGRIKKTLAHSGKEISIVTYDIAKSTLSALSIKFTNVVKCEPHSQLAYLSNLLDLAGCNPGIVAVVHDDITNSSYVKMPNPWYVRDVSCKVHQFLSSGNVPEVYQGVGVRVYSPYWPCEYVDKIGVSRLESGGDPLGLDLGSDQESSRV